MNTPACLISRIYLVALVASSLSLTALPTFAQSSAAPSQAACKIDKSDPTDADIAFYRGDFKKAETLYAAAYAKDPSDSHSHELQIDSLLGQGKLDDARKLTDAWTASESKDPYAILTAADVRYKEGDWLESYVLNLKALKINACIADAYQGLGDYESVAGFHVAAHKHFALAHQLAPHNEAFRLDWIGGLSETDQIDQMKQFIADSTMLTDKQRAVSTRNIDKSIAMEENHCELASSTGPAVIPMIPIFNRGTAPSYYGLEVAFNGHKRVLQIDTGASGFILTRSAGGSLGLPSAYKSRVGGFGDQDANGVDLSRAASVHIGGLEFKNCPVTVLANFGAMGGSHIEGNSLDRGDGLIGSDVFEHYLVTLDYIKHEVRLEPLPQIPGHAIAGSQLDPLGGSTDPDWLHVDRYVAPSMQDWTKIYRRGHHLIMPTRINETQTRLFIVDTGSFTNLIDLNVAKAVTKAETGIYSMRGLSGSTKMSEAGSFTADFAGLRLPVKSMDSVDLSKQGSGISGFLGYPTLEQLVMHIDYRDNLVLFEAPNGKKQGVATP